MKFSLLAVSLAFGVGEAFQSSPSLPRTSIVATTVQRNSFQGGGGGGGGGHLFEQPPPFPSDDEEENQSFISAVDDSEPMIDGPVHYGNAAEEMEPPRENPDNGMGGPNMNAARQQGLGKQQRQQFDTVNIDDVAWMDAARNRNPVKAKRQAQAQPHWSTTSSFPEAAPKRSYFNQQQDRRQQQPQQQQKPGPRDPIVADEAPTRSAFAKASSATLSGSQAPHQQTGYPPPTQNQRKNTQPSQAFAKASRSTLAGLQAPHQQVGYPAPTEKQRQNFKPQQAFLKASSSTQSGSQAPHQQTGYPPPTQQQLRNAPSPRQPPQQQQPKRNFRDSLARGSSTTPMNTGGKLPVNQEEMAGKRYGAREQQAPERKPKARDQAPERKSKLPERKPTLPEQEPEQKTMARDQESEQEPKQESELASPEQTSEKSPKKQFKSKSLQAIEEASTSTKSTPDDMDRKDEPNATQDVVRRSFTVKSKAGSQIFEDGKEPDAASGESETKNNNDNNIFDDIASLRGPPNMHSAYGAQREYQGAGGAVRKNRSRNQTRQGQEGGTRAQGYAHGRGASSAFFKDDITSSRGPVSMDDPKYEERSYPRSTPRLNSEFAEDNFTNGPETVAVGAAESRRRPVSMDDPKYEERSYPRSTPPAQAEFAEEERLTNGPANLPVGDVESSRGPVCIDDPKHARSAPGQKSDAAGLFESPRSPVSIDDPKVAERSYPRSTPRLNPRLSAEQLAEEDRFTGGGGGTGGDQQARQLPSDAGGGGGPPPPMKQPYGASKAKSNSKRVNYLADGSSQRGPVNIDDPYGQSPRR